MTTMDGAPPQPLRLDLGSRLDPEAVARMRAATTAAAPAPKPATEPPHGPAAVRAAAVAPAPPVDEDRARWSRAGDLARRVAQRKNTDRVPLTVGGLCARLGIARKLGEHLVQPYCSCSIGDGGHIDRCAHARDLGV